jgi:hypothetical protein
MGFTQRQAGGRFTRDEADEFIERLQEGESDPGKRVEAQGWRHSTQEQVLGHMPAELLAAELRRRGWLVIEPLEP